MKTKRFSAFFLLSLTTTLFTGCYSVHRGLYRAEKLPNWKETEVRGGTYFWDESPQRAIRIGGGEVAADGTPSPPRIHLTTYAFWRSGLDYHTIKFIGDDMRIIFHDQIGEKTVSVTELSKGLVQTLDVNKSKDFTLVIPSWVEAGVTVPQLTVRLRWLDKKYRIMIPLQ